jgi:nucleoside-diphosphate-sugar epimerase
VVIAMPGGIYGPGDTSQIGELTAQIVAGRRVVTTDGPRMCMAHVDDVARGHLLAMEKGKPGESYILAGPRIALGDFLDLVADLAGARRPLRVPNRVAAVMARFASAGERIVALPPALASETLRAASVSYLGSPAKAERELGWSARPLRNGLEQTIESVRAGRAPG